MISCDKDFIAVSETQTQTYTCGLSGWISEDTTFQCIPKQKCPIFKENSNVNLRIFEENQNFYVHVSCKGNGYKVKGKSKVKCSETNLPSCIQKTVKETSDKKQNKKNLESGQNRLKISKLLLLLLFIVINK